MIIEKVAIAIANARGLTPRTLPTDALWSYYSKERAFEEAWAAIEVLRDLPDELLLVVGEPYGGAVEKWVGLNARREAWNKIINAILAEKSA